MSDEASLRLGTAQGRWVIIAAVLGSGVVFLDGTVVNVALPAISHDLDASVRGLQWMLDGYLVTLSALLLLGGSAGDRYGRRRMFVVGLAGFVRRLGAVRSRARHRIPHRRPGAPGCGRGAAGAGQPVDHLVGVRRLTTGAGPSAPGRVWPPWPEPPGRSSAGGWSTPVPGG